MEQLCFVCTEVTVFEAAARGRENRVSIQRSSGVAPNSDGCVAGHSCVCYRQLLSTKLHLGVRSTAPRSPGSLLFVLLSRVATICSWLHDCSCEMLEQ